MRSLFKRCTKGSAGTVVVSRKSPFYSRQFAKCYRVCFLFLYRCWYTRVFLRHFWGCVITLYTAVSQFFSSIDCLEGKKKVEKIIINNSDAAAKKNQKTRKRKIYRSDKSAVYNVVIHENRGKQQNYTRNQSTYFHILFSLVQQTCWP